MDITNKQVLINALKNQISTRDNQAIKALLIIFNNQTSSEQVQENTHVHNGVGFTPSDAEFMSSLAKQYISKGYLSAKQLVYVKKVMPKYAGQLIERAFSMGTITKEDSKYVWKTSTLTNVPSTDPEEDKWPNANEEIQDDIYWRNKFAEEERKQEEKAFMAKMEWEMKNIR